MSILYLPCCNKTVDTDVKCDLFEFLANPECRLNPTIKEQKETWCKDCIMEKAIQGSRFCSLEEAEASYCGVLGFLQGHEVSMDILND